MSETIPEKAEVLLGKALKPNFSEMDEVFRKYLLPDLEQTVTEKVDAMSMEELEVAVKLAGVVESKQFAIAEGDKHWRTQQ